MPASQILIICPVELKSGFVEADRAVRQLENGLKLIGEKMAGLERRAGVFFLPLLIYRRLSAPEAKTLRRLGRIKFKGKEVLLHWRRCGSEMCDIVQQAGKWGGRKNGA